MAQANSFKFQCPSCKAILAKITGDAVSILGDATITGNFPPANINSNWIKCSKCNQYATIGGNSKSKK
eukprot:UN05152